jgi:hypothetical protein
VNPPRVTLKDEIGGFELRDLVVAVTQA